MLRFDHFNFNVADLDRSLAFYKDALGLLPVRETERDTYKLVYLSDGESEFTLELTYLFDRTEPYDLGECEFHLAFTADDIESMHKKHEEMGCVVFENEAVGVYFITDPDGYWIEIVPERK
ncbi:MAG: VOC family protein [Anaerovoracaceae bacterium]|nr:VOC family protein [Anaerovoracaceae bacterium]